MALSYKAVEKAYEVFQEIKEKHLPDLSISSFPEDVATWEDKNYEMARENCVYGYDCYRDGGWENLFFWTKDPTNKLIIEFQRLKTKVPNSATLRYDKLTGMWKFGWY